MSTPCYQWCLHRIIIVIIILRQVNIITFSHIPFILLVKRIWGIFQMTGNKKLSSTSCHHDTDSTFLRFGNNVESRNLDDILTAHFSMATMRHVEIIIESAENRKSRIKRLLWKYTKHLFIQLIFWNSIEMV